ncbi:hypothetical protein Drose_06055 [Dactylosporangium roseum]|uniref:Uncharacterized protein n=1 Tax=Dactylosporangium roseum TaxID=47989 RepID=A0ABY5Z701_9ACTN|nr:hypothetical protein [Dactylosporangium roseum]UWZ37835.1 hypothetical protein Drose_06055 [Dactylosporangium roseum]
MVMVETFYRLHNNTAAPAFSAEHAYSGLWGSEWSEDGTQTRCHECDGGALLGSIIDNCRTCDNTGWEDAQYGYSCCWSGADLIAYMDEHGIVADDDQVVVFEGQRVGTGGDGEPLAVPTGQVRWTTYGALRAGKE